MRSPRRISKQLAATLPASEQPPPPDSLFWSMWEASQASAQGALSTAFIQGIGSGTLDPVTYGGFNVNDAYYCFNGADDYASAASRATDSSLAAFLAAKAQSYQQYNEAFSTRWRVRSGDCVAPYAACIFYSLLESLVAQHEPPIYTLIVMIPCEYLWAWLAAELPDPQPGNVYGPWITGNNDPSGAYKMGNFLDTFMSANPGVVSAGTATSIYRAAMQYELENFQAATTAAEPTGAIVELDTGAVERMYEDTLPTAASSPLGTAPPLSTDEEYRLNRAARAELIRRRVIPVTDWRDIE